MMQDEGLAPSSADGGRDCRRLLPDGELGRVTAPR